MRKDFNRFLRNVGLLLGVVALSAYIGGSLIPHAHTSPSDGGSTISPLQLTITSASTATLSGLVTSATVIGSSNTVVVGSTNSLTNLAVYGVVTSTSAVPTVTACTGQSGPATVDPDSTNQAGFITLQGCTDVTIQFSQPWHRLSACLGLVNNNVAVGVNNGLSRSNTSVKFNWTGGQTGIYYLCWGKP